MSFVVHASGCAPNGKDPCHNEGHMPTVEVLPAAMQALEAKKLGKSQLQHDGGGLDHVNGEAEAATDVEAVPASERSLLLLVSTRNGSLGHTKTSCTDVFYFVSGFPLRKDYPILCSAVRNPFFFPFVSSACMGLHWSKATCALSICWILG